MGTETELDVEAQTEPPICGFKRSATCTPSPTLAGTFGSADAEDADDADASIGRGSITRGSTTSSTLDTTARVLTPESAHTLSVPDVCALLDTHLE
jgi:hypothetical protein